MLFTDWLFLLVFMLKCTIRILFNKKNLSDKVIYIYIYRFFIRHVIGDILSNQETGSLDIY